MTSAATIEPVSPRRLAALARLRRRDLRVVTSAAITVALALPFAAVRTDAAAVLALAAVALLAGQRWALGVAVVASLMVVRSLLPIAIGEPLGAGGLVAALAVVAALPVVFELRRAAAALALLASERRTRARCRLITFALGAFALFCGCQPFL